MRNQVRFVNYPKQYQNIKPEIDEAILRILNNGDLILRKDVSDFEQNLADFVGTKYAVALNSCTDALFLSLKLLNLHNGDEVITVSHTFVASISVIHHAGAIPILVDVGEDMLMNMDEVETYLSNELYEEHPFIFTKAIIPVHLNGAVCDMTRLMNLADKYNLKVIEDAAQALGAKHKGKMAGSFGMTGCFSFYPAKILGCYGDGGAITTNDEEVARKIRLLRDHCQVREQAQQKVQDEGYGFNSRLDNLQAAILNVKLKYLPQWIERRKEIGRRYNMALAKIPQVKIPQSDTYQNYVLRAQRRNQLFDYLKENGVECLIRDKIPNHFQRNLYLTYFNLPKSEQLANEIISLPMYPELLDSEVQYVIDKIRDFYA